MEDTEDAQSHFTSATADEPCEGHDLAPMNFEINVVVLVLLGQATNFEQDLIAGRELLTVKRQEFPAHHQAHHLRLARGVHGFGPDVFAIAQDGHGVAVGEHLREPM